MPSLKAALTVKVPAGLRPLLKFQVALVTPPPMLKLAPPVVPFGVVAVKVIEPLGLAPLLALTVAVRLSGRSEGDTSALQARGEVVGSLLPTCRSVWLMLSSSLPIASLTASHTLSLHDALPILLKFQVALVTPPPMLKLAPPVVPFGVVAVKVIEPLGLAPLLALTVAVRLSG